MLALNFNSPGGLNMMKKGWIILLSAFIVMALAFSMAMAQKEKKPAKKPKAVGGQKCG